MKMYDARKIFLWLGIALILIIGLIHIIDGPDSFEETFYKGWLFYANGAGAVLAAYGIYRSKRAWGWNLGLLIALGSFICYIISRIVGLPGLPPEPDAWLEPLGVASMIAEGLFILVFISRPR